MSRDEATLLDISNAARLIHTFIQGMTREAFLGDPAHKHMHTQVKSSLTTHCGGRTG